MAKNILIIEDDKFLRKLIDKKLTEEGLGVSKVANGKEGLKTAKEKKPDLILLDLVLPGMNGFEVLSQLKKDSEESIRKIPVIVLSNLGQKEEVEKGMNLGAADYLVKARFTLEEIIEKINTILK